MKQAHKIVLDGDERDFLIWREGSGGTVEIFDIAVGSERRVGKGRKLIEELLRQFKDRQVFAITRADNRIAQQFYLALQFRPNPLWDFYGNERQIDAVLFTRSSKGPV